VAHARRVRRAEASGGALALGSDFTKQALFDAGTRASLAAAGLPVALHFGWHMTCEEIRRLLRLRLKVGAACAPPPPCSQRDFDSWVERAARLPVAKRWPKCAILGAAC
jgi:hypothetical protein